MLRVMLIAARLPPSRSVAHLARPAWTHVTRRRCQSSRRDSQLLYRPRVDSPDIFRMIFLEIKVAHDPGQAVDRFRQGPYRHGR